MAELDPGADDRPCYVKSLFASAIFGASLVGGILRRFREYLGTQSGTRMLSAWAIGAYFGSFLFQRAALRR